jgi:hypothetical protein
LGEGQSNCTKNEKTGYLGMYKEPFEALEQSDVIALTV